MTDRGWHSRNINDEQGVGGRAEAPYQMDDWIRRQLIERQPPRGQMPVMLQRWCHLLFLHWSFPPDLVQQSLPQGLQVDTFEGNAWVGIVPFFMRGVRPRGFPAIPGISNFLELNLRTYVRDRSGRPGIWFYSLDANQALAVCIARAAFGLPYQFAEMRAKILKGEIDYRSRRLGSKIPLHYRYRPLEKIGEAKFGSLEFFLIERYRLFARQKNKLFTGRVHHSPYQLCKVGVTDSDSELFAMDGLQAPGEAAIHAIYSERVDVSIYPVELVEAAR
jgi:uncharacterized protein YqjF (DUF2071 family)